MEARSLYVTTDTNIRMDEKGVCSCHLKIRKGQLPLLEEALPAAQAMTVVVRLGGWMRSRNLIHYGTNVFEENMAQSRDLYSL